MTDIDGDFQSIWRAQHAHLWRVAWLIGGDADLADGRGRRRLCPALPGLVPPAGHRMPAVAAGA